LTIKLLWQEPVAMAPSKLRTDPPHETRAAAAQAWRRFGRLGSVALALSVFAFASASPSDAACSLVADPGNAGARMLQCGDAVTAHLAEETVVHPIGGARSKLPSALRLQTGAVLIEFQPQPGAENFQILTPEAIAAVRGTNWAVEVERGKTSVFVVSGTVEVRARRSGATARLEPGEGVDVAGSEPSLTVKRWGDERVRKLLARFGK
jgi:ferric-dicitrate binding protein FerR (iron transport regulator)